ncbi:MAG: 5'/3'-nucleotidase SurE [Verrucomicrobiaceae bacterium]
MHFLLTNDDGVDAPGLAALTAAGRAMGARITIVAPATEQSMCGHRVTTHSPLRVEQRDADRYAVQGTPADCVRIALFALHLKPDWVLSGINQGGNLGQDTFISGTVAAAREATYHGVKAAALSHYLKGGIPIDWERLARWTTEVLHDLQAEAVPEAHLWNVNFPHHPPGPLALPTRVRCQPARSPLKVSYQSEADDDAVLYRYTARYAERPSDAGSDVATCFGGDIAISQLSL